MWYVFTICIYDGLRLIIRVQLIRSLSCLRKSKAKLHNNLFSVASDNCLGKGCMSANIKIILISRCTSEQLQSIVLIYGRTANVSAFVRVHRGMENMKKFYHSNGDANYNCGYYIIVKEPG